jgi:cytochrome c oxidase assembly factor CtaG
MTDKPLYHVRANRLRTERPALWRLQWWIVGVLLLVDTVAVVLALTGKWAFAVGLASLSSLVGIFILFIAKGQRPKT